MKKSMHPLRKNYNRLFGRLDEGSVIAKRRTTMVPWGDIKDILDAVGIKYKFNSQAGGYILNYQSDLDHEQILIRDC